NVQARFAAEPAWADLLRSLAGRALVRSEAEGSTALQLTAAGDIHLDQSRKVLDFGRDNQYGAVTLYGDMVQGDIFHITIQLLRPPSPGPGIPFFGVPQLPWKTHVPRADVAAWLKSWVLAGGESDRALRTAALHGMGGLGKTAAVTALCHDPEVQ